MSRRIYVALLALPMSKGIWTVTSFVLVPLFTPDKVIVIVCRIGNVG